MLTITYQAIQELLINVLKHSQTVNATVSLRRADSYLEVDIRDYGVGYDVSAARSPSEKGEKEQETLYRGTVKKKTLAIVGVIVGAFLLAPLMSFAAGTVVGKVVYSGKPEKNEFLFSKCPNSQFCQKNPNKELVQGESGSCPLLRLGRGAA